jgi:CheY-like chemotaxis protein/HPt (histidine-containing phosphotransfer) domain-containing protein
MKPDPTSAESSSSSSASERDASAAARREARAAVTAIVGLAGRLADPLLTGAERTEAATTVRRHCRRLLRLLGESESQSGNAPPAPVRRPRVLVAEDCPDSRQAVCSFLARAGFEVTPAENGRVAVALSLSSRFDLVLLDMQMPELDGYATARELRRSGYRDPVIALTGDVQPGDEQACHEAGCDAYLAKPWDPDQLLRVLKAHLKIARGKAKENSARTTLRADPTLQQLAREFARGLPRAVTEMAAALASNNRRHAARLAHQIAGAAGLFGYPDLCRMARGFETAAGEAGECDADLDERIRALAEFSQQIVRGSGPG